MSEPKFSKGPWQAHTTQHQDFVTTKWDGVPNEKQEHICKCGKDNGWNDVYLIATAPEMYQELEKVAHYLVGSSEWVEHKMGEILLAATMRNIAGNIYTLLKKARGEQK